MGDALHWLVVGVTGCGKSRLMREHIVPSWARRGYAVLVLDPVGQDWIACGASWQTKDSLRFLAAAMASERCVLVIDECLRSMRGTDANGAQLEQRMAWLATEARNSGHRSYFLGQRAMMMPPNVRDNCEGVLAFKQSPANATWLAEHLSQPALLEAPALPKGTAIMAETFGKPAKIAVFDPVTLRSI